MLPEGVWEAFLFTVIAQDRALCEAERTQHTGRDNDGIQTRRRKDGLRINNIRTTGRGLREKSEIYASYQNIFRTDQRAKVKCWKKTRVGILERRKVSLYVT